MKVSLVFVLVMASVALAGERVFICTENPSMVLSWDTATTEVNEQPLLETDDPIGFCTFRGSAMLSISEYTTSRRVSFYGPDGNLESGPTWVNLWNGETVEVLDGVLLNGGRHLFKWGPPVVNGPFLQMERDPLPPQGIDPTLLVSATSYEVETDILWYIRGVGPGEHYIYGANRFPGPLPRVLASRVKTHTEDSWFTPLDGTENRILGNGVVVLEPYIYFADIGDYNTRRGIIRMSMEGSYRPQDWVFDGEFNLPQEAVPFCYGLSAIAQDPDQPRLLYCVGTFAAIKLWIEPDGTIYLLDYITDPAFPDLGGFASSFKSRAVVERGTDRVWFTGRERMESTPQTQLVMVDFAARAWNTIHITPDSGPERGEIYGMTILR